MKSNKIAEQDIEEFKVICNNLNTLMSRIKEYAPEANLYTSMDTLNLLCGPSHNLRGQPQLKNIAASKIITTLTGGDW